MTTQISHLRWHAQLEKFGAQPPRPNACWAFEDGQPIDQRVAYAQEMLDL